MNAGGNSTAESAGRILIVDDDEALRLLLQRSLRRLGYQVELAPDGEAGLALAQSFRPNVVLLDLRMPAMDGHTFLRRLAATDCRAPVIVLSGNGTMDDVVDVLRAGAVDYIRKPWGASELVMSVGRAMSMAEERVKEQAAPEPPPAPPPPSPPPAPLPPSAAATRALRARAIVERLRLGDIPVPAISPLLAELRAVMATADASIERVTRTVAQDPRTAADVLRIANSALFSRGKRSGDLHGAVTRIGLGQVHNIVETSYLRGYCDARSADTRELLHGIWRHSLARAIAMRSIAEVVADKWSAQPESAYITGLLADVGAMFLVRVVDELAPGAADPIVLGELLQQHHEELGARILTRWSFDAEMIQVVSRHHGETPGTPGSRQASLMVLASEMAVALTGLPDGTAAGPRPRDLIERSAAELQIGAIALEKIQEQAALELFATLPVTN